MDDLSFLALTPIQLATFWVVARIYKMLDKHQEKLSALEVELKTHRHDGREFA